MADTPPGRTEGGRFGPGNPGRPLGARNRASRRAADAIFDDFELHRDAVLARLREKNAIAYLRAVTGLIPKPAADAQSAACPDPDAWSDEERAAAYADACRLCRNELDPLLGLRDLVDILWRPRAAGLEP